MTLFLRSARLTHNLIGLSCRRSLTVRRKCIFMAMVRTRLRLNEFSARTAVSLAAEEPNVTQDLEQSLYRLNTDMRFRNVLMEDVKEVFNALKERGEMTDPQMMLLLKCCSEVSFTCSPEERIEFAQEIWSTAVNSGKKLTIYHYNALLSVFLENNFKFSPSTFLSTIKENGLEPNLLTYRRLLKAHCQQGDVSGATDFLEQMKQLDFPLGESDFNALIQCHCTVGDFDKAEGIIEVMQDKNIDPTSETFAHLLCGYATHGRIHQLKELLDKLSDTGVQLSDTDLLEVIYALAVNNHDEHIDMILEKLSYGFKNNKNVARIIQRLFHKKLDSVAFKLFEKLEGHEPLDRVLSQSKFILKHFALYREPTESLSMCKELEKKGWAKAAVSYSLRQVLLYKDENYCLGFLRAMQGLNMVLRSHYFWPGIIKASQKGNEEMLEILNAMSEGLIKDSIYTTTKIVFPNYKHSEDWEKDYEKLARVGLPKKWLSVCFMEKLLLEEKFGEVEKLVSRYPVDLERYNNVLNLLIHHVQTNPDDVERFVNCLYYLEHDYQLIFPEGSFQDYYSTTQLSSKSIFDVAVLVFLRIMLNEDMFRRVLQHLLEKKFGITPDVASSVRESGKVKNVDDLLEKLTDPGLGVPNLDEKILKLKSVGLRPIRSGRYVRHDLKEEDGDIEAGSPYERTIQKIRVLIRGGKYQEAIDLVERMTKDPPKHPNSGYLFMRIVFDFASCGRYELAEKAFFLGADKNIISDYYVSFIRVLSRFNMSLAVEKYCELLEKKRNVSGQLEFLIRVVKDGTESDIRKISSSLSYCRKEEELCTYLFIAFMDNDKFNEAKKLLVTSKVKLVKAIIYSHCRMKFHRFTSKKLENYVTHLANLPDFNRTPLYKLVLKKYAEEGNTESLKKLWLLIEEDDISDYEFLEKIRELMNDLSLEKLRETVRLTSEETEEFQQNNNTTAS